MSTVGLVFHTHTLSFSSLAHLVTEIMTCLLYKSFLAGKLIFCISFDYVSMYLCALYEIVLLRTGYVCVLDTNYNYVVSGPI